MSGLVLKNISKSFGSNTVLHDISLELKSGEFLVLLGPSGCGKSTCLRLIAGLESADSGEIFVNSRRIDHLPPKKRQVAMVFQNYSLYPHMTVRKNIAFPLKIAGIPAADIDEKVGETAAMLGLTDKLESRPGQLSGGQRQRVALGRAIVRKPSIFLLDEPLSNLDADLRIRMRREIVRIQREMGCTAVYVTHDQSEALTMADRIALLNEGKIVQLGTPQDLYRNPLTLFAARFIGQPQINLIETEYDGEKLMPLGIEVPPEWVQSSGGCIVALRPEAITIGGHGEFDATVSSSEYLGGNYQTMLEFKNHQICIEHSDEPHTVGMKVRFTFDRSKALFFDTKTGMRLGG